MKFLFIHGAVSLLVYVFIASTVVSWGLQPRKHKQTTFAQKLAFLLKGAVVCCIPIINVLMMFAVIKHEDEIKRQFLDEHPEYFIEDEEEG